MFVLLFGLMGVAAIFPVASHYLTQGDQKDRSDALAANAFAEIETRGLMRPESWYYAAHVNGNSIGYPLIDQTTQLFYYPVANNIGPGAAFVIDGMGGAELSSLPASRQYFPFLNGDAITWPGPFSATSPLANWSNWPVRRVTLPQLNGVAMNTPTAETIFRLRDDLAVEQPDQGDRPAMQRWSTFDANNTPANPSDDTLLARQYQGDYSWLATVVPTSSNALLGLQPAANLLGELYDVSVAVFYKREVLPSASSPGIVGSERLMNAEFLNQGELVLYDANTSDDETLETALDGIRPTNWVCVMGVNQTSGQFMMKWYRILAIEDDFFNQSLPGAGSQATRTLMVSEGGEWPSDSWQNLQVAILPGVIHVQTRQMTLSCECCE
ncbi:hypothetical protein [Bythopirellula polymerisocia]|nr:hypothetical protein [Bythopirellula polymerisocia]